MKPNCHVTFLFLYVLLFVSFSRAQPIIQKVDNFSKIDWSKYVLISSGSSSKPVQNQDRVDRIEALETAKTNAAANLLKAIKKLSLNSNSNVDSAIINDKHLAERVKTIVETFTVVDTRSMSDMSAEIDIELPLTDAVSSVFLPKVMGKGDFRLDDIPRSPLDLLPWPECRPVPAGINLVVPSTGLVSYSGRPYTSLIVDARKLVVKPALLPRILDENQNEVYGTNYADRQIALDKCLVAYVRTPKEAVNHERAGNEPFIVCGLNSFGSLNTDVVISANDAVLVHGAAKTNNFLKACNVIIVISPN